MSTRDLIVDLVSDQLDQFGDVERRAAFERLLTLPNMGTRTWDLFDGREVDVCVFARSAEDKILFVFSTGGYGDPWGVLSDTETTLGMDSQWYRYLEDAFIDSGIWKGDVPRDFDVR